MGHMNVKLISVLKCLSKYELNYPITHKAMCKVINARSILKPIDNTRRLVPWSYDSMVFQNLERSFLYQEVLDPRSKRLSNMNVESTSSTKYGGMCFWKGTITDEGTCTLSLRGSLQKYNDYIRKNVLKIIWLGLFPKMKSYHHEN